MTPTEASQMHDPVKSEEQPKFSVGDQVRIRRTKGIFEKGYLPNWSEVKRTDPITYILKDMNGEIITGGFYTEELKKSNQDVVRIEKVMRKKKINGIKHGLVKWLGYDEKFNEWKPMSEFEKNKCKHMMKIQSVRSKTPVSPEPDI